MDYKDEKKLGNSVLPVEKAGVLRREIISKDAEKMVKAALGSNVFERAEGPVKKDNLGNSANNEAAKVVKKREDQPKHVKENIAGSLEDKTKKRKTEKKAQKTEIETAKEEVLEASKERNFELSRKAVEITLARIDNYQNLWAETEQEGDKKFIEKTRKAWKEFVVHGVMGIDKKTSERILLNYTDLDGKCGLGLLKLAGINTKNVEYVDPGKFKRGKINLDTGDRHGLVVEDEGKTVFMDHHGAQSGEDTSAAKVVYETLVSLELLEKENYLDKLVEFVTQMDNRTYPDGEKHFEHSWHTILGLQRFVHFKHLLTFFQAGKSPIEILSDNDLKKFGLTNRSKEQKGVVESSLAELQKMELDGLIIPSERYGKIAVDIGKKVQAGSDAAKAYGCGGYIIWSPKEASFFINTKNNLDDSFSQGKKVRGKMWIKPRNDKTPLNISLKEILNQMTDSQLASEGKLKKFLEEEILEKGNAWVRELSEDSTEQEKIAGLFEKVLELAKKVDVYENIGEDALKQIAVNQIIKSYKAAKR